MHFPEQIFEFKEKAILSELSSMYNTTYFFFYLFLLFICIKIELMIFRKWKSNRLNLTRKIIVRKDSNSYFNIYS